PSSRAGESRRKRRRSGVREMWRGESKSNKGIIGQEILSRTQAKSVDKFCRWKMFVRRINSRLEKPQVRLRGLAFQSTQVDFVLLQVQFQLPLRGFQIGR